MTRSVQQACTCALTVQVVSERNDCGYSGHVLAGTHT